jgi:hypothetical protein
MIVKLICFDSLISIFSHDPMTTLHLHLVGFDKRGCIVVCGLQPTRPPPDIAFSATSEPHSSATTVSLLCAVFVILDDDEVAADCSSIIELPRTRSTRSRRPTILGTKSSRWWRPPHRHARRDIAKQRRSDERPPELVGIISTDRLRFHACLMKPFS